MMPFESWRPFFMLPDVFMIYHKATQIATTIRNVPCYTFTISEKLLFFFCFCFLILERRSYLSAPILLHNSFVLTL